LLVGGRKDHDETMKPTYRVLALLIALGVAVQTMSIALAFFIVLKDKDTGENIGLELHSVVGMMVIPLLALVLLIISFFAGVAGGVKWAAIIFGLVVLQVLLAFAAVEAPAVGLLHGLNALALIAVAGIAGSRVAKQAAPSPASTEASS
jgi:hypothetical protein